MCTNRRLLTVMLTLIGVVSAVVFLPIAGEVMPLNRSNRAAANRDKTGANSLSQNCIGSQVVGDQPLASRASFIAEGKGLDQGHFPMSFHSRDLELNSRYFNNLEHSG